MAGDDKIPVPLIVAGAAVVGLGAIGLTALVVSKLGDGFQLKIWDRPKPKYAGQDCGGGKTAPNILVLVYDVPLDDGTFMAYRASQSRINKWLQRLGTGEAGHNPRFFIYSGSSACQLQANEKNITGPSQYLPKESGFGVLLQMVPQNFQTLGGSGWSFIPSTLSQVQVIIEQVLADFQTEIEKDRPGITVKEFSRQNR